MKEIKLKLLFKINILYSLAWMKVTGKDKYAFREESKIHEKLSDAMAATIR